MKQVKLPNFKYCIDPFCDVDLCIYRSVNSLSDITWAERCGWIEVDWNFRRTERGAMISMSFFMNKWLFILVST